MILPILYPWLTTDNFSVNVPNCRGLREASNAWDSSITLIIVVMDDIVDYSKIFMNKCPELPETTESLPIPVVN